MNQIASSIRHLLTGLAGIGTYLATLTPVDPATVNQINDAGKDLVDPLAAFFALLAIVAVRLVIAVLGKIFPSLGERLGNAASGGMSGTASILLISTAVAVGGLLPSCAGMTGGVFYRDPATGAKAGLKFQDGKGSYYGSVPLYDDQGNLIAYTELEGPLAREVKATK
jgi:hypothetical protein